MLDLRVGIVSHTEISIDSGDDGQGHLAAVLQKRRVEDRLEVRVEVPVLVHVIRRRVATESDVLVGERDSLV